MSPSTLIVISTLFKTNDTQQLRTTSPRTQHLAFNEFSSFLFFSKKLNAELLEPLVDELCAMYARSYTFSIAS